jgi:hypothetical protein
MHTKLVGKPGIPLQTLACLPLLFLTAASTAQEAGWNFPPAEIASHEKMLRTGEKLLQLTPEENPYLGEKQVVLLRQQLAANPPLEQRYLLHLKLGEEELRLGNETASREQFEMAMNVFPFSGQPQDALGDCFYLMSLASLRRAETENCCQRATPDSCIYPIQGEGIHSNQTGSQNATSYLIRYLGSNGKYPEENLNAIWLLNLAHMTLGTYPLGVPPEYRLPLHRADRPVPADFPRFPSVSKELGVNTFGLAGGVAADDFNGDGWIDLIVATWDPAAPIQYFQNDGKGGFTDESENCHLTGIPGGLNLRQADFDNDGRLDIFVVRGAWLGEDGRHPNSLLRNAGPDSRGVPQFVDVSYAAGIAGGELDYPALSAEWADYDLDGDLDLYVANEASVRFEAPSQLFRNDGPGPDGIIHFTDVAAAAGVTNDRTGKGASWGDYNSDGFPDLYLSNLNGPNRLYQNQGNGSFRDVAEPTGVDGPTRSFPAWFWDYNGDGQLDLFVSNYLNRGSGAANVPFLRGKDLAPEELSALYEGDGRGNFQNRVLESHLDIPMTTMGSNFGDLDNDGYPDIYLGTGTPNYSDISPNLLLHNRNGKSFEDVTIPSGMGHLQKGHSIAFADFRNIGRLDVFSQLGGAVPGDPYFDALFQNPGFEGTDWIQVRLRGRKSNHFGVGSRIRAVVELPANGSSEKAERSIYAWAGSGSSFGSNPVSVTHLGLGTGGKLRRLEVLWPGKKEAQVILDPPVNQRIDIVEK